MLLLLLLPLLLLLLLRLKLLLQLFLSRVLLMLLRPIATVARDDQTASSQPLSGASANRRGAASCKCQVAHGKRLVASSKLGASSR